jgi:hypothetical protein
VLEYRDGRPTAVILDIVEYEELLERAEDLDDLRALRRIREHPLRFRSLSDVVSASPQRASQRSPVARSSAADI